MALGENGWTAENVEQVQAWYRRCQKWRYVYLDSESRAQRWHTCMQVIMFVLMAVSPTTSFASFLDGLGESTRLTMVGAVSSAVMLLRSLQNFWKLEDQIHAFHDTALKFQELTSKLKNEVLTPPSKRTDWNQFKQKMLENMMAVHTSAPTVPWEILKQHGMDSQSSGDSSEPGAAAADPAHVQSPLQSASEATSTVRASKRIRRLQKGRQVMNEFSMPHDPHSASSQKLQPPQVLMAEEDGGIGAANKDTRLVSVSEVTPERALASGNVSGDLDVNSQESGQA